MDFSGPHVVRNNDVIPLFNQPDVPPVSIMMNARRPILFAIGIVARPTESMHRIMPSDRSFQRPLPNLGKKKPDRHEPT